jgi:hypothetical protein
VKAVDIVRWINEGARTRCSIGRSGAGYIHSQKQRRTKIMAMVHQQRRWRHRRSGCLRAAFPAVVLMILAAVNWMPWVDERGTRYRVKKYEITSAFPPKLRSAALALGDISTGNDDNANNDRAKRFPSREQRMKVYMSHWYIPPLSSPCWSNFALIDGRSFQYKWEYDAENATTAKLHGVPFDNRTGVVISSATRHTTRYRFNRFIAPDVAFWVEPGTIEGCSTLHDEPPKRRPQAGLYHYCKDVRDTVLPLSSHSDQEPPLIFQFGCNPYSKGKGVLNLPHFRKFRTALSSAELEHIRKSELIKPVNHCATSQFFQRRRDLGSPPEPIVWLLNSPRFRGSLKGLAQQDIPWGQKQNKAIWRGALTGIRDAKLGLSHKNSSLDNCLKIPRCRLVYDANKAGKRSGQIIDAKLTGLVANNSSGVSEIVGGVRLIGPSMTRAELLQNKIVLILEGHEIASGLLWALLSNSVVVMAPPKYYSWSMETLLVPWEHYVPLKADIQYDNVEDMVQWVFDNDQKAQEIAKKGSLWVHDLVFHPDAAEDDAWIQRELISRYQAYFRKYVSFHNL